MKSTSLKKKRVLVLTSIYPADDVPKEWTPVVHYFTREWVKMGAEVRVINYVSRFPLIAYWIARLFKERISSKEGFVIENKPLKKRSYELEGVNVFRVPLWKVKPHGGFFKKEINKAVHSSIDYCRINNFIPDVLVSHWENPSVLIMAELKKQFNCRTVYIAHGSNHFNAYGDRADECLKSIDLIGYRSTYIKNRFETAPKYIKPSFMCYSGIPSKYVDEKHRKLITGISRFIYVGTLIERKYPTAIVTALKQSFGENDYSMAYIGQGEESERIKEVASKLGVESKVHLLGRLERDEVVRKMDESDVFIMISRNEAFGLVYLEAMACGCITIASRKEGFDGIIQDGVNGFLCAAGDSDELAYIIKKIRKMPINELQKISDAAVKTACELTDEKAAAYYLNQITQ